MAYYFSDRFTELTDAEATALETSQAAKVKATMIANLKAAEDAKAKKKEDKKKKKELEEDGRLRRERARLMGYPIPPEKEDELAGMLEDEDDDERPQPPMNRGTFTDWVVYN